MENECLYKKYCNKCVSLQKKIHEIFFSKIIEKGTVSNKTFWNFVNFFLTNRSNFSQNDIVVIENGKTILEEILLLRLSTIATQLLLKSRVKSSSSR